MAVSSTGVAVPSLDALWSSEWGSGETSSAFPIFGLGCAGGVSGLARAAAMARARPQTRVLFLAVELCSPTFRRADTSKSNIIAAALFGDGAAGAILSAEAIARRGAGAGCAGRVSSVARNIPGPTPST